MINILLAAAMGFLAVAAVISLGALLIAFIAGLFGALLFVSMKVVQHFEGRG